MLVVLGYLTIFAAKCIEVTLATIRTIFVVKGKKMLVFVIGIVEVLIYLFAMSRVLSDMSDIVKVLIYALGFAAGNVVGIKLETRLAIGLITAQIFTDKNVEDFAGYLRERGFGVTVIEGRGKDGIKYILQTVLSRKNVYSFEQTVAEYDQNSFVTMSEIKTAKGGYIKSNMK